MGSRREDEINSMDDCIEGMEEPLYGFRTRITLVDNEPCTLGVTCRDDPTGSFNPTSTFLSNYVDFSSQLLRRQAGEEFSSDAPPDCRVSFNSVAPGCSG